MARSRRNYHLKARSKKANHGSKPAIGEKRKRLRLDNKNRREWW